MAWAEAGSVVPSARAAAHTAPKIEALNFMAISGFRVIAAAKNCGLCVTGLRQRYYKMESPRSSRGLLH
jgi:hypothetical protein